MKNKKDHNNNVTVSLFYSLTIAATGQDSIASLAESSNSAGTSPMMFSANPSSFKSKTKYPKRDNKILPGIVNEITSYKVTLLISSP